MSALQNFNYTKQIKTLLIQFSALFYDLQVQVGQTGNNAPRLIKVPITVASKDRVAAWIKSEQTQNKLLRLPMFSVQLSNITLAPELRKGVGVERRMTYAPEGSAFPTFKVVQQYQPVPYNFDFELTLWASNQDQHYQILEQILCLFDPFVQIQVSDDVFDWTRITQVELTGINFEENVPAGTDRRTIKTSMTFRSPLRLTVPAEVKQNYIKQIYARVGAVTSLNQTDQEIIQEIDQEGIPYLKIFDADNVNIG